MNRFAAVGLVVFLSMPVSAADWLGCRIAYRPPTADWQVGHLLWGCRDTSQVPETHVIEFLPADLNRFRAFLRTVQANAPGPPQSLPGGAPAASRCDRFWLWAEDEGWPGGMSREEKLARACPQ